jgi:broad specificity phosphatase PhoE
MGVVYLVRHGQAQGIAANDELTDLGRRQAAATGAHLRMLAPGAAVVVSGSFNRQRDTADLIAEQFDPPLPRTVDDDWDEYRADPIGGRFDGFNGTPKELQNRINEGLRAWITGETDDAVEDFGAYWARVQRAADGLGEIGGPGRTAIVVTSAGTITAVLAQLWGVDHQTWPMLASSVVNASVTKLVVGASGVTLISFNEHAHLEQPEPLMTYR